MLQNKYERTIFVKDLEVDLKVLRVENSIRHVVQFYEEEGSSVLLAVVIAAPGRVEFQFRHVAVI